MKDEVLNEEEALVEEYEKEIESLHEENNKLLEERRDLERDLEVKEKLILKYQKENSIQKDTIESMRNKSIKREEELENKVIELLKQIEKMQQEKKSSNLKIVMLENELEDMQNTKRSILIHGGKIQKKNIIYSNLKYPNVNIYNVSIDLMQNNYTQEFYKNKKTEKKNFLD